MRATPRFAPAFGPALLISLASLAFVCSPRVEAAEAGEVSVELRLDAGDYGTGESSDTQQALLRYARGDRFRVRLDLPFLRIESSTGVARTSFGTIPLLQGEARRGKGTGSGPATEALAPTGPGELTFTEGWESGVGDLRLGTSARLVGGGVEVFRADALLDVKAPTADEDKGLGTGEWDLRAGVGLEYRFWSATGFAGAGFTSYGDPAWVELDDVADLYAGLESNPFRGRYVLSAWLEAQDEVVAGLGERSALGLGLRILGRTRYRVLATVGLSDAAEDFSVGLGVSFGTAGPGAGQSGSRR